MFYVVYRIAFPFLCQKDAHRDKKVICKFCVFCKNRRGADQLWIFLIPFFENIIRNPIDKKSEGQNCIRKILKGIMLKFLFRVWAKSRKNLRGIRSKISGTLCGRSLFKRNPQAQGKTPLKNLWGYLKISTRKKGVFEKFTQKGGLRKLQSECRNK